MSEAIKIRKRTYWNTITFKEEMKKRNPNIEILGEYVNSKTKVHCICLIDGYEWDATPSDLLKGRGCKKCGYLKNSLRNTKTHEEFLKEFHEKNICSENIEVIGLYQNIHKNIKCMCRIDECVWYPTPLNLLNGSGCPKCVGQYRRTHDEFVHDIQLVNPNVIILEKIYNTYTKVKVKCKIDNHEWEVTPSFLLTGGGCPVCANRIIIKGINDIATKRPDLIPYYDNIQDAYTSTLNNTKKYKMHCIYCGYKKELSNDRLSTRGFSCPICADGISYPNKFSRAFLLQLPIENFTAEYAPKWANGRRYDNYFEYQGNKYIVEMDGAFHYINNKMNGQTKEQSKIIDNEKDFIANNHGIRVIRIDCFEPNKDYIVKNILSSELACLFDLSVIDWNKCDEFASKNLIKQISEYYNLVRDIKSVSEKFKISYNSAKSYLRKAYSLNWSPTYYQDNIDRRGKSIKLAKESKSNSVHVFKDNILIHSFPSMRETERKMNELYSEISFNKNGIKNCCSGKIEQYKGFQFKFA